MILKNCKIDKFIHNLGDKTIICFGAGNTGNDMVTKLAEYGILDKIRYFVDNDPAKWGKTIEICGIGYSVFSIKYLLEDLKTKDVIFITSFFWHEIYEQLESYVCLEHTDCYVHILFKTMYDETNIDFYNDNLIIPKRIYYCWFGNNNMSDNEKRCIESWHRFCPDYEIICINENNYDVYKTRYLKEVYEYGHFSAVSNYARFETIYENGGIYFDTDVEIVRNIDCLLTLPAFMGFSVTDTVNSGHGFGAEKGNTILKEFVSYYDSISHFNNDGKFEYTPCPIITSKILQNHGLVNNGKYQIIDGIHIFPNIYFDPPMQMPAKQTFSVHKYASLWSMPNKDMQQCWEKQRILYKKLNTNNMIHIV